jgi:DNA-directed RNA polymerase specialized sigma24 family protein
VRDGAEVGGGRGHRKDRGRRRVPALADEVAGLLRAMEADLAGDGLPLHGWNRDRKPMVEKALRRIGCTPGEADLVASRLVGAAHSAVKGGVVIDRELAWMAVTLSNLAMAEMRGRNRRREQDAARERERARVPMESPDARRIRVEEMRKRRRRIVAIARALPPPYGRVIFWQGVLGLTHAGIRERLMAARPIGVDRADRILREAHGMFRACWEGANPKDKWPLRYLPGKNPWIGTPLGGMRTQGG